MVVLVLGADAQLAADALALAGAEGDVIVVDPSSADLESLEQSLPDPRVWYQIGDAQVVPLPDDSVDAAVGGETAEVERVVR